MKLLLICVLFLSLFTACDKDKTPPTPTPPLPTTENVGPGTIGSQGGNAATDTAQGGGVGSPIPGNAQ